MANHELGILAVAKFDFDTANRLYGEGLDAARRLNNKEFERIFSHSWGVSSLDVVPSNALRSKASGSIMPRR